MWLNMVLFRACFHAIFQFVYAMLARTMGTAVEFSVAHFHAVPDDLAPAVFTTRRHCMDRTFEAIECATFTQLNDLKCLVIFVATDITRSH
jgi:hypothetical protein